MNARAVVYTILYCTVASSGRQVETVYTSCRVHLCVTVFIAYRYMMHTGTCAAPLRSGVYDSHYEW
eukprot:gene3715-6259_t